MLPTKAELLRELSHPHLGDEFCAGHGDSSRPCSRRVPGRHRRTPKKSGRRYVAILAPQLLLDMGELNRRVPTLAVVLRPPRIRAATWNDLPCRGHQLETND